MRKLPDYSIVGIENRENIELHHRGALIRARQRAYDTRYTSLWRVNVMKSLFSSHARPVASLLVGVALLFVASQATPADSLFEPGCQSLDAPLLTAPCTDFCDGGSV